MQILQLGFAKLREAATVAHSRGEIIENSQLARMNHQPPGLWPTVLFLSEEPQTSEVRPIGRHSGKIAVTLSVQIRLGEQ